MPTRTERHLSTGGDPRTLADYAALRDDMLPAGVTLPAEATLSAPVSFSEPAGRVKWIYVAQPESQPSVEVVTAHQKPETLWKPFAAGMLAMLMISGAAVWGWQATRQLDPAQARFAATLALQCLPLGILRAAYFVCLRGIFYCC